MLALMQWEHENGKKVQREQEAARKQALEMATSTAAVAAAAVAAGGSKKQKTFAQCARGRSNVLINAKTPQCGAGECASERGCGCQTLCSIDLASYHRKQYILDEECLFVTYKDFDRFRCLDPC